MKMRKFYEGLNEFPRKYTPDELAAIAKSLGPEELPICAIEKLQELVEQYQWGCSADLGEFPPRCKAEALTNKGRRKQLNRIIGLCKKHAAPQEIEEAYNKLDGPTRQLLGTFDNERKLFRPQDISDCDSLRRRQSAP